MKKRLLSLLAILALLVVCAVLAVNADGADVRETFVCPCSDCVAMRQKNASYKCPQISQWQSISTTAGTTFVDGGHYYVGTDTTAGGQLTVPAGAEVVLLIDHATLRYETSSKVRMINMTGSDDSTEQSMSLHVIGNNDACMQEKYLGGSMQGPMIQIGAFDIGHFHLYGDLTLACEEGSNSASDGGLIKITTKGRLYMHDSEKMGLANTEAPTLVGHTATGNGGTIYMQSGSSAFTMEAGTVQGGSAVNGGAISMAGGTVNLKAGNITGGTASGYGGAIYAEGGTVNIGMDTTNYPDGPTISGSTATSRGGGAYFAAGVQANMGSGSISGCYAGAEGVGGAVYVRGDSSSNYATFHMSGGTITVDPTKSSRSRGVRVQGGTFHMSGTATVVSAGGGESGAGIDCLGGKVSLDGAARVYTPEGKATYDILVRNANSPKVTVNSTWTGWATIRFNKIVDEKSYTPGGVISSSYAASTGDYTGELYLQSEVSMPRIYGKDGKLVFSDVQICDENGIVWYKNNAEAVAAVGSASESYIKLYNGNALDLGQKDVCVDFNGNNATVTGTGTLYGMDSTAGTQPGTAQVTATGITVEPFVNAPVSGESYVAVTEDGVSTFHVIKPVVSEVTLRAEDAAMYYSGQVICDEIVAQYIQSYGVAVQLDEMPGQGFAETSFYTQEQATLAAGGSFNGILVKNIMKENAENGDRADRVVYANAYVTVKVGDQTHTYLASDSGNDAAMSLKTLVGKANAIFRSLNTQQQTAISGMYADFKTTMTDGTWRVNNIAAANGDDVWAEDEDGLKILMIGNSLSVDAGRMLSYVFAVEGYDNVRISTMYKSGCKLYEHADFIASNEAAYTFYDNAYTDAAAVVANPALAKPTTSSNKTLLYGLQQDDWDIIVMQQGSSQAAQADTYNEDIQTITNYVLENDKDPSTKPIFIWNSIWGYPYNADKLADAGDTYVTLLLQNTGSSTADAATQIEMVNLITQAAKNKILTNDTFSYVIPTGTAFIHACAALSNEVMYNDYIHASDLGRMMVSYVWYSAITGKAVEDIPNAVPKALLRSGSADRAITANEKAVLLDCIAKAFAEPYTMPNGFEN